MVRITTTKLQESHDPSEKVGGNRFSFLANYYPIPRSVPRDDRQSTLPRGTRDSGDGRGVEVKGLGLRGYEGFVFRSYSKGEDSDVIARARILSIEHRVIFTNTKNRLEI